MVIEWMSLARQKQILLAKMVLIVTLALLSPITAIPTTPIPRYLSQQPQPDPKPPAGQSPSLDNMDKNTFLLVIVIGSIVFIVVALICCIVCIVRCIIRIERSGHGGGAKVGNLRIGYAAMCPKIQYGLFQRFVGVPFQDNCVICLEQFKSKSKHKGAEIAMELTLENMPEDIVFPTSDQIKLQISSHKLKGPKEQQIKQSKQTQYVQQQQGQLQEKQQNFVKLTICGHLLHAKCLDSWLEKEQSCPLCRQQFTLANIHIWQQKLDINLLNPSNPSSSVHRMQSHPQQTLNSMNKSNEQNIAQLHAEMQYNEQLKQLKESMKEVLILCAKIMAYHKREKVDLEKIRMFEDCCQFQIQECGRDEVREGELHFQEAQAEPVVGIQDNRRQNRRNRVNNLRRMKRQSSQSQARNQILEQDT